VVKPSVKKSVIGYLKKKYQTGIEQCSKVVRMSRSSWYYTSKLNDQEVIIKLMDLAKKHPTRGFDNYYHRIRREGYKWSRSKVLRVYRELGLVRRPKRRRRLPEAERKPLKQPNTLNEVWSMDFMSDTLNDGRPFRILKVMDDYNRESLLAEGSISFPSCRVIRELEQLVEEYGIPKYIRTDNGTEFRSKVYAEWFASRGIRAVYIEPGNPMQNGYIERLNRTFREDVLDAYLFTSINQFKVLAQKWRDDYNKYHPHKSLGNKSPIEFGIRSQHLSGLAQIGVE